MVDTDLNDGQAVTWAITDCSISSASTMIQGDNTLSCTTTGAANTSTFKVADTSDADDVSFTTVAIDADGELTVTTDIENEGDVDADMYTDANITMTPYDTYGVAGTSLQRSIRITAK